MEFSEEQLKTIALKTVRINVTNTGKPAVWEYGGSRGQRGYCQIVADSNGADLVPIFVTRNPNPNAQHALFPIRRHSFIIRTFRAPGNNGETVVKIDVMRVTDIDTDAETARAEIVAKFRRGQWDEAGTQLLEKFSKLQEAVTASLNKVREFNCKRPFYFKEREDKQ